MLFGGGANVSGNVVADNGDNTTTSSWVGNLLGNGFNVMEVREY